ncbi:MAG: aldolase/citrate lyase family protein [Chthoniobacteraceae bacterium]
MRKSKIKAKLESGGVARIAALGSFIPFYPHMAAHFGYDGVWCCAEHKAWDPRQAETIIAQHRLADIDCVWRPATTERAQLSRILEDGAAALMIPMVNTPEQARQLVAATKFPPIGDRGLDGAGMDGNFYLNKAADYTEQANRETLLVVQIESPLALDNAAEIAATPGVDVLFMGPGDLSLRLGCSGAIVEPKIQAAIKRMAAACDAAGKPWGFPCSDPNHARIAVEMGCRFLAFGGDFWGLHGYLQRCGQQLDEILGAAPLS